MKAILTLLMLTLCLGTPAWGFMARTKGVLDGDSIRVFRKGKKIENIRLYGIDAPETRQAYGLTAKKRLSALAARQTLDIEPVDTDRYGRTVALVRLQDGTLLNEVMVAEGLAWVYDQYCQKDLCLRLGAFQARAREQRRGLWAGSYPMPPAEWRKEHKHEEWYAAPRRTMNSLARTISKALRH